jgi:hypothetical protein
MPLSFAQAFREFSSTNTQARVDAARRLLREAGEPGVVSAVIAHDTDGYRPAVMAALSVPDEYAREAARYLGAWHGSVTQQPRVVAFHVGEGADRLHTIRAVMQPEQLADALKAAGVHHFALRTTPTHAVAHVYDQGGTRDFTTFARSLPHGDLVKVPVPTQTRPAAPRPQPTATPSAQPSPRPTVLILPG